MLGHALNKSRFAAATALVASCALVTLAPRTALAGHPSVRPAAEGKKYTCPMHPEVNSDKPGKCPKCGMALVEKK